MDADLVSQALVVFTGKGLSPFPVRNVDRFAGHFGALTAADLAAEVQRLHDEFYKVEPRADESLVVAADRATAVFVARHPELTSDAVDALRWCYTYDWK
ncbi:hypothetical protein [uncultured Jatrophihabitans sp.]|uniref:hypothetical protein n=1 Tax=uncultured Jatrophihabitans sp. TaxID=1610747 RepID=UPI0035CB5BD5